jgi:hypothetical protein
MAECPDCGARIALVRVILNKPFPCPSCGRELIVAEPYMTRLRWFCSIVAMIVVLFIVYKFWIGGPITARRLWPVVPVAIFAGLATLFAAGVFAGIFAKRIFMPKLEDHEEK